MARIWLPTFFISHGGGPWPWLLDMRRIVSRRVLHSLETLLPSIPVVVGGEPKAVLMVSGHWEGHEFAVMVSARPSMV